MLLHHKHLKSFSAHLTELSSNSPNATSTLLSLMVGLIDWTWIGGFFDDNITIFPNGTGLKDDTKITERLQRSPRTMPQ